MPMSAVQLSFVKESCFLCVYVRTYSKMVTKSKVRIAEMKDRNENENGVGVHTEIGSWYSG